MTIGSITVSAGFGVVVGVTRDVCDRLPKGLGRHACLYAKAATRRHLQ